MTIKKLAIHALVIAVYVGLSVAEVGFAFQAIQVRVAEVLVLLCLINIEYTISLTIACLITNVIGIMMGINFPLDFIFGTFATLLSCLSAYYFRKKLWFGLPILSLLMPCIFNGIIIGAEIAFYSEGGATIPLFLINCLLVFVGEFIACVIFGSLLYKPFLNAYQNLMDKNIGL